MHFLTRAGTIVLAAAAAGCVVGVDSQGQISREEKRFTVSGRPELHLRTFDGSIQVHSGEEPEVLVEIEKRGPTRESVDAVVIEATQRGNRIDIEVKGPRSETFSGFGFHVNSSARLTATVPRRVDVMARTGDGAIDIAHLDGRFELRTGDGAIRASGITGDMRLETGDGSVTVDRAEGRLSVETGDGGVNVSGNLSAVRLHTGDGAIVYRSESDVSMAEDWDVSTGDGSIALFLPASFSADLDAHTGDGTIRTEIAVAAGTSENNRRTVRGRLGDGGRRLRIRTGDGSISLKAR